MIREIDYNIIRHVSRLGFKSAIGVSLNIPEPDKHCVGWLNALFPRVRNRFRGLQLQAHAVSIGSRQVES